MSAKKNTEVLIGGKKYTISGYEEEEYLQRVASYINSKLKEFNEIDSFRNNLFGAKFLKKKSILLIHWANLHINGSTSLHCINIHWF